jgi:peptidase inhibitor family I36
MARSFLRVGIGVAAMIAFAATALPAVAEQDGVPPSTDATGYARCPSGYFCAFVDPNGQGPYAAFKIGSPDLSVPISGYVFDNKFSSVWNRNGQVTWWLHPDKNYGGNPTEVIGWDYQGNLGNDQDVASSLNHS